MSVSADGSVVAGNGTTENGSQAFIWTESSGMVNIGNVADTCFQATYASMISADGKVFVGLGINPSGDQEAFRAILGNPVSVTETHSDKIEFYPNPAQNTLQIKLMGLSMRNIDYLIIDMTGKILQQGKLISNTIDVSGLEKGIYFLRFELDNELIRNKFVVE